ncbi:acidic mammalian chitinase-like [Sitophilus oryzae]|uniref:Acidic mammalian chitinase-like n=1 Tax=Sitophilus oryzae TaxID=7048 RepID=A0A6J2XW13_SITOR|nr:acidic mammalian chitinase-like [Sitophilus oryzae]
MIFPTLLLVFLVNVCSRPVEADICESKAKIVCYFASWAIYRDEDGMFDTNNIDPTLCTDIIYSFAGLDINLQIASLDTNADINRGGLSNITALKENNPCVKISLAVGGWGEGSIKYSVMASSQDYRDKFADSVLKFITYYNFDGIDLDWEYPTSRGGIAEDKDNFVVLLKTVKEKISPWGFQLSIAVGAETIYYNIPEIYKYVDYIHIMGYDLIQSTSNVTGLSAPFTPIKASINAWLEGGTPASKLILGVPAYGHCFNLLDASDHEIGSATTTNTCGGAYTDENGFLAYYEILLLLKNGYCDGTEVSDDTVYSWCGDEWLTYDNEETVATKTQYVLDQSLGGVMVWSLDTDDFLGLYGNKHAIVSTIYNTINSDASLFLENYD